jgi:hypothetical protein
MGAFRFNESKSDDLQAEINLYKVTTKDHDTIKSIRVRTVFTAKNF